MKKLINFSMIFGIIFILFPVAAHAQTNNTWNMTTIFPDGKWGALKGNEKKVNATYNPSTQLFEINFKAPGVRFNSPSPTFFYDVFYKVTGNESGKVYKEGSTSIMVPFNKFKKITFSDIDGADASYKLDVSAQESVESGPIYPPDFTPYTVDAHALIVKN